MSDSNNVKNRSIIETAIYRLRNQVTPTSTLGFAAVIDDVCRALVELEQRIEPLLGLDAPGTAVTTSTMFAAGNSTLLSSLTSDEEDLLVWLPIESSFGADYMDMDKDVLVALVVKGALVATQFQAVRFRLTDAGIRTATALALRQRAEAEAEERKCR